jgi:hypothetical protein
MQNYNALFTREQILGFAFTELDQDSIALYMEVFSTQDDDEFCSSFGRDFGFKIQTISRNRFTIIY